MRIYVAETIVQLVIAIFSAAVFVNLYVNTFPCGPWSMVAKHDCIFFGNQVFFCSRHVSKCACGFCCNPTCIYIYICSGASRPQPRAGMFNNWPLWMLRMIKVTGSDVEIEVATDWNLGLELRWGKRHAGYWEIDTAVCVPNWIESKFKSFCGIPQNVTLYLMITVWNTFVFQYLGKPWDMSYLSYTIYTLLICWFIYLYMYVVIFRSGWWCECGERPWS